MKAKLDTDDQTSRGRAVKVQDGPMLMSPKGSLSRPLTYDDFKPEESNNDNSNSDDKYIDDEVDRIVNNNIHLARDSMAKAKSSTQFGTTSSTFRDFYGGAMTINLPASYRDVSDLRQVPDHQEVYLDSTSSAAFIMEILEIEDSVSSESAASYYFDDLAQSNHAIKADILSSAVISDPLFIPSLEKHPAFAKCCLIGKQTLPIRKSDETEEIIIMLVVIRLNTVGSDLLITTSCAVSDIPSVASLRVCDLKWPSQDSIQDINSKVKDLTISDSSTPKPSLKRMNSSTDSPQVDVPPPVICMRWALQSLRIVDWSLFA